MANYGNGLEGLGALDNYTMTLSDGPVQPRKLRAMIITMGGERQKHMEELFAHQYMAQHFEPPVFSPGVPSRSLRNRYEFFRFAHDAGLIPQAEWEAIQRAQKNPIYQEHPERFFECLDDVPVTQGRQGSQFDVQLHYSVELWRKAKTVNRGRAVLGCTLAHLIALKRFVKEGFDFILEDNVRCPLKECATRIWEAKRASDERCLEIGKECHFRYLGWLGSIPNLRWIYESHSKRTAFRRSSTNTEQAEYSLFPFPQTRDIEKDLALHEAIVEKEKNPAEDDDANKRSDERKPGGNPIWGSYAYWISKEGYESLLEVLQNDVGALLWKSKRARYYTVKPVDKVLPRQIMKLFGQSSVQLSTHPAFFRAPMLTSKIHTQWDQEFCKSTGYQLQQAGGLQWSDLWLTQTEQNVVSHRSEHDQWLTTAELEDWMSSNDDVECRGSR